MTSIADKLNAPLPSSVVRERAEQGITLSYVDGHYVMSKLNEVFGNDGWAYDICELKVVEEGVDEKQRAYCTYEAVVRLTLRFSDDTELEKVDVGYGHGVNKRLGKAKESAGKEAVTDALKRAARSLGPSMGLALYDAQKRDVVDDAPEAKPKRGRAKQAEAAPAAPAVPDAAVVKTVLDAIMAATTGAALEAVRGQAKALQGTTAYEAVKTAYLQRKKDLNQETAA